MVDHFGGGSVTQMIVNHWQHSHVQLRVGNGQHTREHSSAKDVLTVDVPRPNSTVLLKKISVQKCYVPYASHHNPLLNTNNT